MNPTLYSLRLTFNLYRPSLQGGRVNWASGTRQQAVYMCLLKLFVFSQIVSKIPLHMFMAFVNVFSNFL